MKLVKDGSDMRRFLLNVRTRAAEFAPFGDD